MRVKIQSMVARDPDNLKMITHAVTALARVIMTKFNISKSDKKTFAEAMENALKDIVIPGGVGVMQFLKNEKPCPLDAYRLRPYQLESQRR